MSANNTSGLSRSGQVTEDSDEDVEIVRGHSTADSHRLPSPEIAAISADRSADQSISGILNISEDDASCSKSSYFHERQRRKRKLSSIDSNFSAKRSVASWSSTLSRLDYRSKPIASSTPYAATDRLEAGTSISEFRNDDSNKSPPVLDASSLISEESSPVLYYGAPMPGTPFERRRAMFREALSIDDTASTPTAERVQEAPEKSSDFVPKLASTADGSRNLDTRDQSPAVSPIL